MSQRPINRSRDLKKLRDEGYDLEVRSGCLLVKDVPYVNSGKEIKRGILVIKLVLADDQTGQPDTHVAYFSGEYPCNEDGTPIEKIKHGSGAQSLAEGVTVEHTFSAKPKPDDAYPDYHAQVTTYVAILSGPAQRIDPSKTARTYPLVVPDADDDEPFNYIDTASSRAEIVAVDQETSARQDCHHRAQAEPALTYWISLRRLLSGRFISMTATHSSSTMRSARPARPPAPTSAQSSPKPRISRTSMQRCTAASSIILSTSTPATSRNCAAWISFSCVWTRSSPKKLIVEKLEEFNIPFTDVGMGIQLDGGALGGILRVTTSTSQKRDHFRGRVSFEDAPGDDDYNRNIQIADLNALNAALAVMKWKKLFGFYRDLKSEHHSQFGIDTNLLINEDRPQ